MQEKFSRQTLFVADEACLAEGQTSQPTWGGHAIYGRRLRLHLHLHLHPHPHPACRYSW